MNPWQQLGAKIYTGKNLQDTTLQHFISVGGQWVTATVYNDNDVSADNLSLIEHWRNFGITVGAMCNGLGGDPEQDALKIAALATEYHFELIALDLEGPYQYPEGDANLMPILVKTLRGYLPNANLAVNTNGLNNSMIWNGRTVGGPKYSFYNLKIRVEPQWYNAPIYSGCWCDPVCNMQWLQANEATDENFHDPTQKYGRAVPLSYVHGCLEATGVENANLVTALPKVVEAKKFGFTYGISLFPLERVSADDLNTIANYRGILYL